MVGSIPGGMSGMKRDAAMLRIGVARRAAVSGATPGAAACGATTRWRGTCGNGVRNVMTTRLTSDTGPATCSALHPGNPVWFVGARGSWTTRTTSGARSATAGRTFAVSVMGFARRGLLPFEALPLCPLIPSLPHATGTPANPRICCVTSGVSPRPDAS